MKWQTQAAMPPGMVAAILSDRYGCDGKLASLPVIVTYLSGLAMFPLAMLIAR